MKIIKEFLFLISAFFALFSFGDCADCEAYKTQVASDCDSIVSSCDSAIFDCQTAESNASLFANYYASNSTERATLIHVSESASKAEGTLRTIKTFAQSIKLTAQSLQCSTNTVGGSCDCAQYLQSLISLLTTCNQTLAGVSSGLNAVRTSIGDVPSNGATISDNLYSIEDASNNLLELLVRFLEFDSQNQTMPLTISDFASVTNSSIYLSYLLSGRTFTSNEKNLLGFFLGSGTDDYLLTLSYNYPYINWTSKRFLIHSAPAGWSSSSILKNQSLSSVIKSGLAELMFGVSALNTYSRTNLYEFVASRESLQSFSEKFSIFNDFAFSSDAPLSMYTDMQTDGSYHDYLTNYYIKVSKGQQSGSDNFTNWFSRVELLLAALVFQDDDNSSINTNGVPSDSDKHSVAEVGSSLGQTISGFVQDGNSHVSSVDTSGKSIIRMVTSWNTAIGQTAKPAPFVVAEFSSPDSQSRSNISLYFDTEDEKLSSLIEIGHGISTLAWVAVFLLLGYNLAVYSIRVLRRLISFSFSLYSAIFGGG